MLIKVQIGPIWADWPTPHFVLNGLHCRPPNTRVGNFFNKMDPPYNFDFVQEKVEIF